MFSCCFFFTAFCFSTPFVRWAQWCRGKKNGVLETRSAKRATSRAGPKSLSYFMITNSFRCRRSPAARFLAAFVFVLSHSSAVSILWPNRALLPAPLFPQCDRIKANAFSDNIAYSVFSLSLPQWSHTRRQRVVDAHECVSILREKMVKGKGQRFPHRPR